MKIIIDLDGTICTEEKQFSRALAKVNPGAKKALDNLKEKGYTLIIYSARTWAEYELTIDWLNKNQIPFDQLILGKPQGDYWIDDRAIKYKSWESTIKEIL
tara:strand:- start:3453 stop:3755 length:303 start_codon:yes stop_codon:yes gene_type:complete